MILADADVQARLDRGAPLPDQNRAREDRLSGEYLYAEPLTLAVSTVSGSTATFFMGHLALPSTK